MRSGPIDEIFATLAGRPDIISFAVGSPDTELLPADLLVELVGTAVAKYGQPVLQYGMTRGFAPLLQQADKLLRRRGIHCDPDMPQITTGGSGGLHSACMALLDPGGIVLVETPTYGPAVKTFHAHGATVAEVECDQQGMTPAALDRALSARATAFVYLLPTFQNPTGRTIPAARRAQLAEVILRHDALVIEDDIYTDLRYRGEPVPTFWSFAPENTIYLTSLSKTFAPASRIGIAVPPPQLSEQILALKQCIDMQTSTLAQAIAAEFLSGGYADAHLARIVGAYSSKLDTLSDALERHLPREFHWVKPDGGMFLWIEGPAEFDADLLLDRALGQGVAFLPGSVFYPGSGPTHRNTMRLSFASIAPRDIERGIGRLATLLRDPV